MLSMPKEHPIIFVGVLPVAARMALPSRFSTDMEVILVCTLRLVTEIVSFGVFDAGGTGMCMRMMLLAATVLLQLSRQKTLLLMTFFNSQVLTGFM